MIFETRLSILRLNEEHVRWLKANGTGRDKHDQRFGQFLVNNYGTGVSCSEVFHVEDASIAYDRAFEIICGQ